MNLKKYLLYSFLLCIPIPLVTSLIGFHLGRINDLFQKYSGTTLILYLAWAVAIIAIAIGSVIYLRRKSAKILAA